MYDGEFKNDECNGFGILYYPDGKRFEGNWKDGKKHGKGNYIFPGGQMYNVVYTAGKKSSEGKMVDGIGTATVEQLKHEYQSLAKKATSGKDFLNKIMK